MIIIQSPGQLQPENWEPVEIDCLSIEEGKLYNEKGANSGPTANLKTGNWLKLLVC